MIARIALLSYLKSFLKRIVYSERSPEKLALSFSIGIFIAFSPYIGFHNIMIFLFSWIFKLNTLTTFAVAHINNPFTTLPLFSICYFFGKWILNFIDYNITFNNPTWINFLNNKLTYYLGAPKICFWTFFIGANLLGLILALLMYPIMKMIFKRFINVNN